MNTTSMMKIVRQIVLIIIAILISSIVLSIAGYDFGIVFSSIGAGISYDMGGTIRWLVPLVFMGLAVCIPFRANIFNMGMDGQLYIGAITATFIASQMSALPAPLAIIATIVTGTLAGALYAWIPAIMKIKLNCNEVVSTLLFNFVAYYFTDFLVLGPMLGTGTMAAARSTNILPENTFLPNLGWFGPSNAHVGLFIAIAFCIVIAFFLFRTRSGFEIKVVGDNPEMARYSGISPNKVILRVMLISGAISGLCGAIEILGVHHRFPIRFSDQIGFDGVVVSLLAGNHPIGIMVSGFFFAALQNGALNMQRLSDLPSAMIDVVRAIIIMTISVNFFSDNIKKKWTSFLKRFHRTVRKEVNHGPANDK